MKARKPKTPLPSKSPLRVAGQRELQRELRQMLARSPARILSRPLAEPPGDVSAPVR